MNAELTIEERALAKENPKYAFIEIPESCPARFARRMIECRRAIIAGQPVPPPSAAYIATATVEYRNAMQFESRLFPTPTLTLAQKQAVVDASGLFPDKRRRAADEVEELALRIRLRQTGERLAAEQREAEQRGEQERTIRNCRREMFPFEVND